MNNRFFTLGAALAFGTALVAVPASAASTTLEANAQYQENYADGSDPYTNSASSGLQPSAYASVSESYGYGYGYSSNHGILGAQARAGNGGGDVAMMSVGRTFAVVDPGTPPGPVPTEVWALGDAKWQTTITNDSGSALDYTFIFHVYGPTLQTAHDSGDAAVSLSIFTDTLPDLYEADARLSGTSLTADSAFGPASYDSARNSYYFDSFDASVSLGTIAAGESFTLTYLMGASAYATDMGHESYASIGDPFGFGDGPDYQIITQAVPGAIPEPATWALMIAGFGLTGMAVRRRREQMLKV